MNLTQSKEEIENKTDFIVSWHAKKYNKVIFRVGNMNKEGCRTWETDGKKYNKFIWRVGNLNKEGCRTWEQDGKKYMCFWDTVLERYTTCIDPMITYKRKVS